MKPCSRNRKLIAWMALDALEARQTAALKDHLDQCEGCRRYWEEVSNVTERLASAAPESNLAASESFHHKLAGELQAVESGSVRPISVAQLRDLLPGWRVALPATAVLVIAILVLVAPRHPPAVSPPAPDTVQVGSPSSSDNDLTPTLANYQMIAGRSLEKFDELLTQQGSKPLPPCRVFTPGSGLALVDASF